MLVNVSTHAKYTLSKSDKPMVQFTFEITDGEFKGRTHNKFMLLCGNDEAGLRRNLNRYGTELKKYGIIATSIKDSFEQVGHTVGTEVKLTLSTKNEFLNTSVEVL